jgi:Tfp pilus assembly protein PilV
VRAGGSNGISVAEVLVAVVVLTVGVLALVGASAGVSRMIGRGRHATLAAAVMAARIEELQRVARSSWPPCTATEWRDGSAVESAVALEWSILDPAGLARRVRVIARPRSVPGAIGDTAMAAVLCGTA